MSVILLVLQVAVGSFHGCPDAGDNVVSVRTQALDVLKNRSAAPTSVNAAVTLEELGKPYHDDRARWKDSDGASLTGYVVKVGPGGRETANCHASFADLVDTHVHLALSSTGRRPHLVVTEVTPRWREEMKRRGVDWSTAALAKLVGKRIVVTGWLMLDVEHVSQSENTHHPGSPENWRQTAWEIHPVTNIEVVR